MPVKPVTKGLFQKNGVYDLLMHPGGRPSQSPRTELGERIVRARERRGISQYELADLMGTSQQSVTAWERKVSSIRSDTLVKLATILEVSADELLGLKPPSKSGPSGKVRQVFDEVARLPRRQQQRIVGIVEDLISARKAEVRSS